MDIEVQGAQVHVYTGGQTFDAALPSVVLVHGAGLDHTVWIQQSRYLAHHGYGVLALDLPGHGRSQGPALETIGAMAARVIQIAQVAGAERFAVIGHSMGALVALETAARAGDAAWYAALLGVSAPMAVADMLLDAAREDRHAAYDMINIWGHALGSQIGGNPAPGMWMVGSAVRLLERSGPGVLYGDLAACNAFGDGHQAAAAVRCPTQLVVGTRDMMTPSRGARALAGVLETSGTSVRVTEIEGSGHMLMSERPDAVREVLASGLADARPG